MALVEMHMYLKPGPHIAPGLVNAYGFQGETFWRDHTQTEVTAEKHLRWRGSKVPCPEVRSIPQLTLFMILRYWPDVVDSR